MRFRVLQKKRCDPEEQNLCTIYEQLKNKYSSISSSFSANSSKIGRLYLSGLFMPPISKNRLGGHFDLGLFVRPFVRTTRVSRKQNT